MNDVKRLLVIKANLETVMQRDLETSVRVYAEQQLDAVCKEIEEAREEWDRLFEPQKLDQMRARVSELEEMLKQSMRNNDELRNDNYQLCQRVAELEASNAEMLDVLEDCCVIAKPENPDCCCPNYQPLSDGDCAEAKNGDCHIWKAIQKARG